MTTARKAKAPAYEPETRYAVTLARVVEHEGFTFRPGAEPLTLSGALLNAFPDAVASARALPPEADLPEPPEQVHEHADGSTTVVNAA